MSLVPVDNSYILAIDFLTRTFLQMIPVGLFSKGKEIKHQNKVEKKLVGIPNIGLSCCSRMVLIICPAKRLRRMSFSSIQIFSPGTSTNNISLIHKRK